MRQSIKYISVATIFVTVVALTILSPLAMFRIQDKHMTSEVHLEDVKEEKRGYYGAESMEEKLSIISRSRQAVSSVVQRSLYRPEKSAQKNQVVQTCKDQIALLQEQKIMPKFSFDFDHAVVGCSVVSYIDMEAPSKGAYLWHVTFSEDDQMIQVAIDMDSQKIVDFFLSGKNISVEAQLDGVERKWGAYLGLSEPYLTDGKETFIYGAEPNHILYRYRVSEFGNWYSLTLSDEWGKFIKATDQAVMETIR